MNLRGKNMIALYSDLQKIYNDQFDIMVKRIDDYVDAYKSILDAIYFGQSLTVVVQNKYCLHSFEKMQEHYPDHLTIKTNSPRLRFQELVGSELPEYITDEDVVNDRLVQQINEFTFNQGMSFENNTLNHYLGSYFTKERFPFSKLVDFFKKLNLESLKVIKDGIILEKIYKKRMNLWQINCNEDYEKNILQAFLNNHELLFANVAKYLILKNFSNRLAQDVIGDICKDFDKLRLKADAFIPVGMDTTDITRNIKIHLNKINAIGLSHEDIVKEIEKLIGLFNEELQFVYKLLDGNRDVLDASILNVIRRKFKTGPQLDLAFEEKLKNIIPPGEVKNPKQIAHLDDWISWAVTSYLPYKFWMESNDISDENIDNYSQIFGDWIYDHYDSIIFGDGRMLYKTIANLSSFLKKDELSLIIMIDNFNYKYVSVCKNHLNAQGFSTTIDQPMLSMIPSETSVSKAAFFTGQPFNTEEKSYDSMCKEWEAFLGGSVAYLSDIGKLEAIQENASKVYILNYLSIDKILHESQSNSALPINQRIQAELKAMIDKVVNFSKKLGVENKIKIYFISDHGSTKIIREQHNLISPKYYKAKTDDCAYRFIALQDNKFELYKDGIGHLCYVLDRNSYGIKENYLIARGYNRFMETDSSFYVHGGISPEECIIPLLKFERINMKFIYPEMLLGNNEFRYSTTSTIQLSMKNHNEYALDNIEITIISSNVHGEKETYLLAKIDKETQVDINLDKVRILKSNLEKEMLMINVKFDFLGIGYAQDYEFPIKIKSTQENKIDFDDLF